MRNFSQIEQNLCEFLCKKLKIAKNFIIGVSGGLDSAVVATLCAKVSAKNTYAFLLPTMYSNSQNLLDGENLCKKLGINYEILCIDEILKSYKSVLNYDFSEQKERIRFGNLCARIRMSILYDFSAKIGGFVVGTGNKSEIMLGYCTIFGDTAYAFNPIGNLYKSEIFDFAAHLGVDVSIIQKSPSADLWANQTDESDLGYGYEILDKVLKFIDLNGADEKKLMAKFDENLVKKVLNLFNNNKFKSVLPEIAEI